jgi:CRISPR-associated protein Cas1
MTAITDRITIYLNADVVIERRGGAFLISTDENRQKIPALKIKDIIVTGRTNIDSRVVDLCRESEIPIHFLSGRWQYQGSLWFAPAKNLFIRRAQIFAHFDHDKKTEIAKTIVSGKLRNMQSLLDKFRMRLSIGECQIKDSDCLETARGVEGAAGREYFSFWPQLIKNDQFSFKGRSKRPPADEVNALLSLVYTLLFNELHTAALLVGFDPAFGYLHDVYYGRPSLICDLLEEWRPIVGDRFVLNLVNRKEITPDDFRKDNNSSAVLLSSDGLRKVLVKWHDFFKSDVHHTPLFISPVTFQRAMERQVRLFSQYLLGDRKHYQPFYIK